MKSDPIIEEVRRGRKQLEDEIQQDAELYYQLLKKIQEPLSDRLVCRQPKPLATPKKKKVA